MPQPDYEDDLVFPPQERLAELSKTVENLSSENKRLLNLDTKKEKMSLTEKWKKQILESGYYFFKEEKGSGVQVGFVTLEGDLVELVRDVWFFSEYHPNLEIVAPCDYKEVQRLNKILKNVLESNEALAVNINELSRKIEAYQLSEKEAQEIIAELNYKNEQLSQLLKESIRLISYEHEVYEAENFIKEVNEVLK
jgi:hypothetical protein|nr:MAG TPA: hypothetical protein [Caudoviricetes sp.]